jgi:hypothetical protein
MAIAINVSNGFRRFEAPSRTDALLSAEVDAMVSRAMSSSLGHRLTLPAARTGTMYGRTSVFQPKTKQRQRFRPRRSQADAIAHAVIRSPGLNSGMSRIYPASHLILIGRWGKWRF